MNHKLVSILNEFKAFALRGNVVDLAIGVIIGAAFSKVVSSLVSDVLMPPLGYILGGVDFSDLSLTLKKATEKNPSVEIKYGLFLNNVLDFVIIAFVIFAVVKLMNQLRGISCSIDPPQKECPECAMKIPYKAKKCSHCCSNVK